MCASGGPPPLPIRARLRDTDAQVQNSRVAMGLNPWTLAAVGAIILGFFLYLYILDLIR
jgi:hypothetical protein